MEPRAAVLQEVLELLCDEERTLETLFTLALEEQSALIQSDFAKVNEVSERMLDAAGTIERIEEKRLNLLRSVGAEELSLEELLPLADDLGVTGFASARLQLGARAQELKAAQEQNARLLLNAMKVRDRWANLLGGYLAPNYGNDGRRNVSNSRGTVSRSA